METKKWKPRRDDPARRLIEDCPWPEVNRENKMFPDGKLSETLSPYHEEWPSWGERIYYIIMKSYVEDCKKEMKKPWKDRKRFAY